MEAPQARPPPPPKPKPRPKANENLNSSQDNLAEPPAVVAPQFDATVTTNVPGASEPQPPKPKTVRKKPPPSQEAQPAVPQPLGDSSENLQGDAQPAKKAPAKKKVVKKATPAPEVNVESTAIVVPAPAVQANAEVDGPPLAKPKTAGAKRTVKKPPRPPSTELQTNPAAIRSLKELEQEQMQPIVETTSPPPDAVPALPKKAPPSKTTRKAAKQPEPAVEEPVLSYDGPTFVQPAPIEPSYELTANPNNGKMHVRPEFDDYRPSPPPAELNYAQEPDAPAMYPPANEPQDVQDQTNQPQPQPQAQAKAKEQKAAKGGLFSSLRQSFSKPKSTSKSKSKNDQPEEGTLTLAGTFNSPMQAEELPGPMPMHGSQPLLDVAPAAARAGTIGGKAKSASTMNVKPASGSTHQCVVIMLDGEEVPFDLLKRAVGRDLTDKVFDCLDLVERDFFGLTYTNQKFDTWFWLHEDKPISKQLKDNPLIFRFQVKFYPPDPVMLKEELSRYQLCLQIRQDLYYGKLPCSWVTQALLGSYMVQSEIGDFDEMQHGMSIDYLRSFAFIDSQTDELLAKIAELHRTHRGLSPAQADQRYLENAKRLELYGVDLHATRDAADTELQVSVCHAGVVVYKNQLRLNRFAWPKVLKISYKKDIFLLRIRTDRFESQEIDCAFRLANHKLAKRLWRFAVESHTFYRLKEPPKSQAVGNKSVTASMMSLISLGSTRGSQFRYSGRTLHQATGTLGRSGTEAPAFERLAAKRSTTGSMPNISGALSMSIGPSQQQAYAAQAANSGSMASLVLPPPRAGVLQTSRSMEMLNSGAMGRSMTLADGSNFDVQNAKSDKNAKKSSKRDKNPPALPAAPAPAPLPVAAAYDDQFAQRPEPLDYVDASGQPPAPRYTKRTRAAKPHAFDDDENL